MLEKSTMEPVFCTSIRQFVEKHREKNKNMCVASIDLEKGIFTYRYKVIMMWA